MSGTRLAFSRDFDLPPVVVWDAFVDEDLVAGWLAGATIEPRVGGTYDLRWLGPSYLAPTTGRITGFEDARSLVIETSNIGTISFELTPLDGGPRGTSTRLDVTIESATEPRFSTAISAHWLTNLEQLDDLLRGHPVDWANWERDRGQSWNDHFDAAASRALLR